MSASVALRPAEGGEALAAVVDLLEAAGLPTADLRRGVRSDRRPSARLFLAVDGERVGAGGLEVHGDAALLRSIVVVPDRRGEGYGRAICRGLEARARDAGVATTYLLTTDAADVFAALGYERVERAAAPPAVRATRQFRTLCPDSATCLRRVL